MCVYKVDMDWTFKVKWSCYLWSIKKLPFFLYLEQISRANHNLTWQSDQVTKWLLGLLLFLGKLVNQLMFSTLRHGVIIGCKEEEEDSMFVLMATVRNRKLWWKKKDWVGHGAKRPGATWWVLVDLFKYKFNKEQATSRHWQWMRENL